MVGHGFASNCMAGATWQILAVEILIFVDDMWKSALFINIFVL
jgi:hypothetical protein